MSHDAMHGGASARSEMKLAEETFLTDDFLRQLINVGEVDILVGLPTHNNAKTIGAIVQTIQGGILRWFPRERAVIINADGGSRDGTPELVTGISIDDVRPVSNPQSLRTLHSISTRYASNPSRHQCIANDSGCGRTAASQSLRDDVSRLLHYGSRMDLKTFAPGSL